ncbi:MAG: group III truncated hemoglobin [Chitinophagaceae bacterium]|nr:group III truncated hemoglobin [Chitinophagaceae bacterium]
MKQDIQSLEDIKLLVNTFYDRVQNNELLAPVFASKITDWTPHLEKMYRFWQTILLHEHTYSGSPFSPHAQLPVEQNHFDEWLGLWEGVVDEFFAGENAEEAKKRGKIMAQLFHYKIGYLRAHPAMKPLV